MEEPRWLDEREQRTWRGFIEVQAKLFALLAAQLQRDAGLSEADYVVLVQLSEAPEGRLRAFELAAATQWEKSRLSHHLSRMERRGLVQRRDCPTDARGAFFELTDEGRAKIEAAAPLHVAEVRRYFFDALTAERLDALHDINQTLIDWLEKPDPQR